MAGDFTNFSEKNDDAVLFKQIKEKLPNNFAVIQNGLDKLVEFKTKYPEFSTELTSLIDLAKSQLQLLIDRYPNN